MMKQLAFVPYQAPLDLPEARTLRNYAKIGSALAFYPHSRLLASGHDDSEIRLWDDGEYKSRLTMKGHRSEVHSLHFSPDGQLPASSTCDGTFQIWYVASGLEPATVNAKDLKIMQVRFSPDSRTLAVARAKTIEHWDLNAWIKSQAGHDPEKFKPQDARDRKRK